MNNQEKLLMKSLCSFQSDSFNSDLLDAATPTVLGQLFFNRMQSIAYGNLKKKDLLGFVNREFRNSLQAAYEQNLTKNKSFVKCIEFLNEILSRSKNSFAMLKGAYLCNCYPEAYRTSNDIDLLALPEAVSEFSKILLERGFKQGNIRNGEFQPATRKEIIESKMTRGETVPYIKEMNLPGMRFLEVDINFSLDYKPGDTELLENILASTCVKETGGISVTTLTDVDFFLHLCSHLYKEATTLPWVKMKRDMTLYKYCDIYFLLTETDNDGVSQIFKRAKQLDMAKVCAFAIIQTSKLFDLKNGYAVIEAENILKNEPDFLHTVFSPKDKKRYLYCEKDIENRFFAENRANLLREVIE